MKRTDTPTPTAPMQQICPPATPRAQFMGLLLCLLSSVLMAVAIALMAGWWPF